MNSFLNHIYSKVPTGEGESDKIRWHLTGNGMFDVRSYYKAIRGTTTESDTYLIHAHIKR